jgi:cell division protein FtsQ
MWDNPRLLNGAAGFLVGLAALAFAAGAAYWLLHSALFPVRTIELRSALKQAPRAAVQATLASVGRGNFFAAPIDELRSALERLPWVRRAAVRRVWPDGLEVSIEEQVPLARWAAGGLVNQQGERFAGEAAAELPLFGGPAGTEAELARRYLRFSQLIAPLGSPIKRLTLSARLAWELKLANGLELKLGRDAQAAQAKLGRFVAAREPNAVAPFGAVVDLRYPNGFAVRIKG